MTDSTPAPDAPARPAAAPSRASLTLATGFGLGYLPWAPGTAGSLLSAAVFALLYTWLAGAVLHFVYLFVLAWLVPLALWSTEQALGQWTSADPQPIVIDEIVGQWLAYAGVVLPGMLGQPGADGGGWKSLLAGFILFRAFDVLKPFPLRRSERLRGAAGVVVDDLLAGAYAALGLLLLAWTGWLK